MQIPTGPNAFASPVQGKNMRTVAIASGIATNFIQTRYLPRESALLKSTILPIIGSLIASQTRAAMNIIIMNNGVKPKTSV